MRVGFLLLPFLAACGSLPEAPDSASDGPQREDRPVRILEIDREQSQIVIFVYRAGALAALGHNHIVSTTNIRGQIELADRPQDSSLELLLPVASFVVDDPDLRAASGEDFSSPVDAEAIAGTRANMLGTRLLDVARFPTVEVLSKEIVGTLPELSIQAAIQIRDEIHIAEIPVTVVSENDGLRITGEFSLRQSSLGLKPFTLFLGALAVADELRFRIHILAR